MSDNIRRNEQNILQWQSGKVDIHMYHKIDEFEKMGINEFIIDLSSLNAKFVSILLTNLLNYLAGFKNTESNTLNIYGIED